MNLVPNGSFEAGNDGSFTSQYAYVTQINAVTQYTIASNPSTASIYGWASFGDHTTGSGLMLIANGATASGVAVWSETVAVQPGATYTFSFWAASVDPTSPASELAELQAYVGGTAMGTPLTVSATAGQWMQFSATWSSGSATSAALSIQDVNTVATNNDFALDDVSFAGCP